MYGHVLRHQVNQCLAYGEFRKVEALLRTAASLDTDDRIMCADQFLAAGPLDSEFFRLVSDLCIWPHIVAFFTFDISNSEKLGACYRRIHTQVVHDLMQSAEGPRLLCAFPALCFHWLAHAFARLRDCSFLLLAVDKTVVESLAVFLVPSCKGNSHPHYANGAEAGSAVVSLFAALRKHGNAFWPLARSALERALCDETVYEAVVNEVVLRHLLAGVDPLDPRAQWALDSTQDAVRCMAGL